MPEGRVSSSRPEARCGFSAICAELFTPDTGFFRNDLQMAAFFEICQGEIMVAESVEKYVTKWELSVAKMNEQLIKKSGESVEFLFKIRQVSS